MNLAVADVRVLTRGLVQRFDARRDTRSHRLGERESPNAAGPSVDGASRSRTGDLLLANPIAAVAIAFGLRRCRTNRPQTQAFALTSGLPLLQDAALRRVQPQPTQ